MELTGIVAEYNPFHNGHAYQIAQAKEQHPCDGIVAVMSGNFTQRGEAAVFDKWTRTELALHGGADLVLFTGGIGENAWFMRRPILEDMECLGMKVDLSLSDNRMGEDIVISTPDSKVAVVVVTTDEEFVIASDTFNLVK